MQTTSLGAVQNLWQHTMRWAAPCAVGAVAWHALPDTSHIHWTTLSAKVICYACVFSRLYFGDSGLFQDEALLSSVASRRGMREDALSGVLLIAQAVCMGILGIAMPLENPLAFPVTALILVLVNVVWLLLRTRRNHRVLGVLVQRPAKAGTDVALLLRLNQTMILWILNNVLFLACGVMTLAIFNSTIAYYVALFASSISDLTLTRRTYASVK